MDRISWDAYNESYDLESQIERYRKRFGHYPASAHADKIYRTRYNRRFCKEKGMRLSGPSLGRPKRLIEQNGKQIKQEKRLILQDERDRNAVEGKFGQGKRRFGLGRIMAKLALTSETMIAVSFLVMNLEKMLSKIVYCWFYFSWKDLIDALGGVLTFRARKINRVGAAMVVES